MRNLSAVPWMTGITSEEGALAASSEKHFTARSKRSEFTHTQNTVWSCPKQIYDRDREL